MMALALTALFVTAFAAASLTLLDAAIRGANAWRALRAQLRFAPTTGAQR